MDLALIFTEHGDYDLVVSDNDLLGDDSPLTPATVSLHTDRMAMPDDTIPDGTDDRRGWWGDSLKGAMGSRLWLLSREKRLADTVERAAFYAAECLEWIVLEGGAAHTGARAEGELFSKLLIDAAIRLMGAAPGTDMWTAELDVSGPVRVISIGGL
jgi:phage gp46-like protein